MNNKNNEINNKNNNIKNGNNLCFESLSSQAWVGKFYILTTYR